MEIVVPPPALGYAIFLGLPALTLVVALLLRGRPLVLRILPVVLVSAICAGVWRTAGRPLRFAWDAQGIRDDTFGGERRIAWADVREARLVRAYRRTRLRPVRRTNGTYYDGFSSGTFELADGRSVRVFLEPTSDDALLVRTPDATYLYSPRSFERFLEAARSRTLVTDGP